MYITIIEYLNGKIEVIPPIELKDDDISMNDNTKFFLNIKNFNLITIAG